MQSPFPNISMELQPFIWEPCKKNFSFSSKELRKNVNHPPKLTYLYQKFNFIAIFLGNPSYAEASEDRHSRTTKQQKHFTCSLVLLLYLSRRIQEKLSESHGEVEVRLDEQKGFPRWSK
jgi:hypothetical protein